MTIKKIEFSKKPLLQNKTEYIDAWVAGKDVPKIEANKLKRTTIYLPESLHKKLKIEAAKKNTSMTDIIIETLEKYVD